MLGMYQRTTNQLVLSALEEQAAVVLLGPRQVGKTTLARQFVAKYPPKVEFFDLENPIH